MAQQAIQGHSRKQAGDISLYPLSALRDRSLTIHTQGSGRPKTALLTSGSSFSESCLPSLGVEPSVLFENVIRTIGCKTYDAHQDPVSS